MSRDIQPHIYSPDYQAMGDCRVCGHGQNKPWHSLSSTDRVGKYKADYSELTAEEIAAPLPSQEQNMTDTQSQPCTARAECQRYRSAVGEWSCDRCESFWSDNPAKTDWRPSVCLEYKEVRK